MAFNWDDKQFQAFLLRFSSKRNVIAQREVDLKIFNLHM